MIGDLFWIGTVRISSFQVQWLSLSVWSVVESISHPLHGISQHHRSVVICHLIKRTSFHFVLQEIEELNLKIRIQFGFFEDVELLNNLVKCLNLELILNGIGFNVFSQKSNYC